MNKYSVGLHLAEGTRQIFMVPEKHVAIVNTIMLSNHSGNNKTATIWWEHGHDASHDIYIVDGKTFELSELFVLKEIQLVMREGDKIKTETEAGSDFSLIVTFDLFPDNSVTNNFDI